jgi:hypothetical protein
MTATTKTAIKQAIAAGLSSTESHACYGGCARIYLKAGLLLSVDELFSLNLAAQTRTEKARQKNVKAALELLDAAGFKTIRGKAYIGYDNNDKKVYSKAVNLANALIAAGIPLTVEGIED